MTNYHAFALGLAAAWSPSLVVIAACVWRVRAMRAQQSDVPEPEVRWQLIRAEVMNIIRGSDLTSRDERGQATTRHRLTLVR
jgi:hypothetical protein